ncbi:hypothetical protein ACTUVN_002681 [Pseudomonas caspiana]
MKKTECEPVIRSLTHQWAALQDQSPGWHPSFGSFVRWLRENSHDHYLDFKGVMPAMDVAEQWFDEELKQTWRN